MPTPATTSLTISTLLDLVGHATTVQPSGSERGAFDAILQAPAASPRHHEEPPQTEYGDKAYREGAYQEGNRTARNEETDRGGSGGVAEDAHGSDAAAKADREAEIGVRDSTAEKHTDEAVEGVDREVNAVIAATSASLPPQSLPVAIEGSSEDEKAGGVGALGGVGEEGNGRCSVKANAQEAIVPPVTAEVAMTTAVTNTYSGKQQEEGKQTSRDAAAIESAEHAAASVQDGEAGESSNQNGETDPTLSQQFAESSGSEMTLKARVDLEDGDDQSSAPHDPLTAVEHVAKPEATPVDPGNAQAADAVPLVAPAHTPQSSGQTTASPADQAAAIAGAGTAKRSRLPAEMLTHGPAASKVRGPVEVHSERLLARVARALAAAEAREGEVRLRLSPPELGSLRLELKIQDGVMIAHVEAETETARAAIVDNLSGLRDRLAEQGVRIERFDVDLMQRHAGGAPNQSDQRQSNEPQGGLRVALPPRRTAEATVAAPIANSVVGSGTSGLNVIV